MTAVAARRRDPTTPPAERQAFLDRLERLSAQVGPIREPDDTTELHVIRPDDREATAEAIARLRRLEAIWRVRGRDEDTT